MQFFRRVFNGANFFLIFLFLLVIISGYFTINSNINSSQNENNQSSFRVLSEKRNNFNQTIYYVQKGFGVYQIKSPKEILNIGGEYFTEIEITPFNIASERFGDRFSKSLGIVGEIKINDRLFTNSKCDWYCSLLKFNATTQRNINTIFFNFSCGDFDSKSNSTFPKIDCRENASLSSGLVTGDTSNFTKETNDNFKKLGLSHLVAVSGFQVVLLTSFMERIFLGLNISRKKRIFLSLFSIFSLILLVGPQPPVIRSSLTLILIYFASILGRSVEYWRALVYSAIIMLFINPFYIYSASFQLSFLASLALGSNIFHQVNPKTFIEKFGQNLFSNINIFFFTLPVIVNLSGFVSPVSIIVNLVLIPIIPVVSILNILGLVPIIGQVFLFIPNIFQSLLLFLTNDLGPNIKLLYLSEFSVVEIIIYYFVLCFVLILLRNVKLTIKTSTPSNR